MKINPQKTTACFMLLAFIFPLLLVRNFGQVLANPLTSPITPTPTPVPTIPLTPPVVYHYPVISTKSLASAKLNRPYNASVKGYDTDGDSLTMKIALPVNLGLTQTGCLQSYRQGLSQIECRISGTPVVSGSFDIVVTLTDSTGRTAVKNLLLLVR